MNLLLEGSVTSVQPVCLRESKERQRKRQDEGVKSSETDVRREADRHIDGQKDSRGNERGRQSESREKIEGRMKERGCEKQKKYPLDSRCPSNRLVLVGWLVAGLEAG